MEKYGKLFQKIARWIDETPLDDYIEFDEYDGNDYFLDEAQLIEDGITDLMIDEELESDEEYQEFFNLATLDKHILSSLEELRNRLVEQVDELNQEFEEEQKAEADFDNKYQQKEFRDTRF